MGAIVLITGGSSGIGKATGDYLTEKGFTVYGTSRNPNRYPNHPFQLLSLDVTDAESIQNCIKELLSLTTSIDILINNAGAGINGAVEELPEAEMRRNFETNLFGPIAVIKAVLPVMRQQQSGLIINITSIAGYMGLPFRGVYSASKGALHLLSETLSMELKAFGIKVVTLAPGDVATNIAAGRYHAPLLEDSPYKDSYEHSLNMIDRHVDDGSDPRQMAQAIYKIILKKSPKIHYREGAFLQKFSVILKSVLPDRIYEKLLLNHYKL